MGEDPFVLVGKVLDHALLGAEMLLREAGDWDGAGSYGGRLYATTEYLRRAQTQFRAAGEQKDTDRQMREVMNRVDAALRERHDG
jgi:hypothetical protein